MSNTLALIHIQYGPYHFARVKALLQLYPGTVKLIQLASKEAQREWDNSAIELDIITLAQGTFSDINPKFISQEIIRCLAEIAPSIIVIPGYGHPAMRAAASWAKQRSIPKVLLSDSNHFDKPRNLIVEKIKGTWIRQNFDSAFVAGSNAADYLSKLGFPKERIWRGYDVVDNHHFKEKSKESREQKDKLRKKLKLPDNYFLYVGRFSSEKNLSRLLKAYKLYCQEVRKKPWSLVLVGSGSQEQHLKKEAANLSLKNVFWYSFKQIDELPHYYALASAFILPSVSEPWGLVINEAMACGLPILLSQQCGCLLDLVFPGLNGYVFDPLKVKRIAAAMISISSKSNTELKQMGQMSNQIIDCYTPQNWAKALIDCVEFCLYDTA